MTARLSPYVGEFPDQQEWAEDEVRSLVEGADGRLTSRQALAVLRVCIDEINLLRGRVEGLSYEVDDLRGESRRAANVASCLANGIIPD